MEVVAIKHVNNPYAQGYADCKEGKEYYPHYWVSYTEGEAHLLHGNILSKYDRAQYVRGWDAAIVGEAL